MESLKKFSLKSEQSNFQNVQITRSLDAYNLIKDFYFDDIDIYESSFILLLNQSNKTIGYAKISQGGINGTVIDVRIVAKFAVESLAVGVILAHNHPSGNLNASKQDISIAQKIGKGLKILDITLIDSLILTSNGYISMKDEDLF